MHPLHRNHPWPPTAQFWAWHAAQICLFVWANFNGSPIWARTVDLLQPALEARQKNPKTLCRGRRGLRATHITLLDKFKLTE